MIDVFDYSDFRVFLREWYLHKKQSFSKMSYRWFQHRVHSKNPNILGNIIHGRTRLVGELLAQVIPTLEFTTEQEEYFRLLVRYQQTDNLEEKDHLHALIHAAYSQARPNIDETYIQVISNPICGAILELCQCVGFQSNPQWIAATLEPPARVEQVEAAIRDLQAIGLLEVINGELLPRRRSNETPAAFIDIGSYPYHRKTDQLATQALTSKIDQSIIVGSTMSIPSDRLEDLRRLWYAKLNEVAKEVDQWEKPDRVLQVNLRVFPVSRRTTDEPQQSALLLCEDEH